MDSCAPPIAFSGIGPAAVGFMRLKGLKHVQRASADSHWPSPVNSRRRLWGGSRRQKIVEVVHVREQRVADEAGRSEGGRTVCNPARPKEVLFKSTGGVGPAERTYTKVPPVSR